MNTPIRVVIVDDNPDLHDAILKIVSKIEDIVIIGQAYDGAAGVQLCQIARPDVVLMDVVMPKMDGAETTAAILRQQPAVKVIALSSYHEYEHIRRMLTIGAIGYLVKGGIAQDLVSTIRSTMQGNTVLSPQAAKAIFSAPKENEQTDTFSLTDRELQVLQLMADGLTYSGIAHQLRISSPTVRFHVSNILEKMQVDTRSQALVLAAQHNLLQHD